MLLHKVLLLFTILYLQAIFASQIKYIYGISASFEKIKTDYTNHSEIINNATKLKILNEGSVICNSFSNNKSVSIENGGYLQIGKLNTNTKVREGVNNEDIIISGNILAQDKDGFKNQNNEYILYTKNTPSSKTQYYTKSEPELLDLSTINDNDTLAQLFSDKYNTNVILATDDDIIIKGNTITANDLTKLGVLLNKNDFIDATNLKFIIKKIDKKYYKYDITQTETNYYNGHRILTNYETLPIREEVNIFTETNKTITYTSLADIEKIIGDKSTAKLDVNVPFLNSGNITATNVFDIAINGKLTNKAQRKNKYSKAIISLGEREYNSLIFNGHDLNRSSLTITGEVVNFDIFEIKGDVEVNLENNGILTNKPNSITDFRNLYNLSNLRNNKSESFVQEYGSIIIMPQTVSKKADQFAITFKDDQDIEDSNYYILIPNQCTYLTEKTNNELLLRNLESATGIKFKGNSKNIKIVFEMDLNGKEVNKANLEELLYDYECDTDLYSEPCY